MNEWLNLTLAFLGIENPEQPLMLPCGKNSHNSLYICRYTKQLGHALPNEKQKSQRGPRALCREATLIEYSGDQASVWLTGKKKMQAYKCQRSFSPKLTVGKHYFWHLYSEYRKNPFVLPPSPLGSETNVLEEAQCLLDTVYPEAFGHVASH